MAVSVGLCRAGVRRTCVQTGGGGVLQLRDGKAMFESVTISSSEAFVSTALAAAGPVGCGLGGDGRRRGVPTRRCELAVQVGDGGVVYMDGGVLVMKGCLIANAKVVRDLPSGTVAWCVSHGVCCMVHALWVCRFI